MPYPEEGPIHRVQVDGLLDGDAPGHQPAVPGIRRRHRLRDLRREATEAGRTTPTRSPSLLVPGSAVFIKPDRPVDPRSVCWWDYIPGACWRHPEGPDSKLDGREEHPVVQVVYEDVAAYAAWAGLDIPSEAEWEFAARGGLEGNVFAWGNEFKPGGKVMANTWEGRFPDQNLKPRPPGAEAVGSYPANGYGLYDMIGNVWEWTDDWYTERHPSNPAKTCCTPKNPPGRQRAGQRRSAGPGHRAQAAQGPQGRLLPLRPELLPTLPAGRALSRSHRQRHQPHRFPAHQARSTAGRRFGRVAIL